VSQFLSEGWLAELGSLVSAIPFPADGEQLALGQLVVGAPGGDVGYTIRLGADAGPRVVAGVSEAEVVLVEDYATARAVAAGERSAAEVMAEGLVKLRGNAKRLVTCESLLTLLAGATAELQATTTF
jgi:hypothetical protein